MVVVVVVVLVVPADVIHPKGKWCPNQIASNLLPVPDAN